MSIFSFTVWDARAHEEKRRMLQSEMALQEAKLQYLLMREEEKRQRHNTVKTCAIPGYAATACPCCHSREFIKHQGLVKCSYCRVTQVPVAQTVPSSAWSEFRHRPMMK